jgi:excisionase family DNA binding protein
MNEMKLVDEDRLLTSKEAAEQLGLKNKDTLSVWRTTKRYQLPYIKVGRLVRYRTEDVQRFLHQNTIGGF